MKKKKNKKNKGRKSLTAVGAVVAAGLTPSIVTSTPASQAPSSDVEFTAADVVSINGDVIDFDELFAMHQVNRDREMPKLVYGPPPSKAAQNEEERQAAIREEMRKDSIRRAEANQERVYGPPYSMGRFSNGPERIRQLVINNKARATNDIMGELIGLIADMTQVNRMEITPETDIFNELKLDSTSLKNLSMEIEQRYGVMLADDMLKQLNTVSRLTNFIVTVIEPIRR